METFTKNWVYWVLGAVALVAVYAFSTGKFKVSDLSPVGIAHAADKGGPSAAAQPANGIPPLASCGLGVQGGGVIGELSAGGPGAIAGNGTTIGLHVRCLMQIGVLSLGGEVSQDWVQGDLHTLGVNRDLTVGGSLGIAIVPKSRTYLHAGWTRVDGSFGSVNHVDGWKGGIGNELQLSQNVSLDLRYSYGVYDVKPICGAGCPIDATSHAVRLGLTYNFVPPFGR